MGSWIHKIATDNKSIVLADQMVFSGNNFLTTLLMARILSPENFGVYASIILLIYLVISILTAIVMQPLQVTLSKIANKAPYLAFSFWLQLILLVFLLLVIALVINLNLTFFEFYNSLGNGIILLTFGFVMQDYFRKLFLASGKLKQALQVDALTAILHITILITALLYVEYELLDIIVYLGLAYVPAIALGIFFVKPKIYKMPIWESHLLTHIHQSKWLVMTALVQWWSSNLFVVASGIFLGIKALGAFRLVQSVFGVFNLLLQTFENYVLPQAARLLVNSHEQAKIYIRQIGIKSSILFGLVLLPIFIFSKYIIVLIGGTAYAEYSFVVKGMSILYFIIFLGYPIRMAIRVLILNRNFLTGYIYSLLFSLLSFSYLLKEWGLMGAIAGLIVSQLIVLGYWQFILIKNNFILWK
ncbi:MAG: hypothetical protein COA50_12765 [Flavobacteriaceae bacterium]|nr:MAG: hypothetical protein COA50_12765 [Flavobacteriaceae bacterium]